MRVNDVESLAIDETIASDCAFWSSAGHSVGDGRGLAFFEYPWNLGGIDHFNQPGFRSTGCKPDEDEYAPAGQLPAGASTDHFLAILSRRSRADAKAKGLT